MSYFAEQPYTMTLADIYAAEEEVPLLYVLTLISCGLLMLVNLLSKWEKGAVFAFAVLVRFDLCRELYVSLGFIIVGRVVWLIKGRTSDFWEKEELLR